MNYYIPEVQSSLVKGKYPDSRANKHMIQSDALYVWRRPRYRTRPAVETVNKRNHTH